MNERDPMNLSGLPQYLAPDELWPSIERRLRSGSGRKQAIALAAAAALLLAILFAWIPERAPDEPAATQAGLAAYWHASARLETELDQLESAVLDAGAVHRATQLENRLAWIDHQLGQAPDDIELWRRRLLVLDELNDVYANQAWLARLDTTIL